jgi:DNA polymerase-3 subunit delta'
MTPAPHPRQVFAYEGGEAQEAAFLESMARGRLHHAWLLTGPEGVGKATFAYRAARRLLGARPDAALGRLGSSPEDPVSRQIASRSHPDLLVLERDVEDGKPRKYIPVDDARRLPEFFAKAPASAPYRVAIIDAADDMNVNAANALLKTLEEPPARGVLFLISHAPGGLIATIRSRCRRLAFPAWSQARVEAFLSVRAGASAEDAQRLAVMARCAPGRALSMAEGGALKADAVAHEILARLPDADDAALLAIADGFRGAEGQKRFEVLFDRLADRVREMAVRAAQEGPSLQIEGWARAWDALIALPRDAETVNLDRGDALFTAIGALRAAARQAARVP